MKKLALTLTIACCFWMVNLFAEAPGCSFSKCGSGTVEGLKLEDPIWTNDYDYTDCSNDCIANGTECCYSPKWRVADPTVPE